MPILRAGPYYNGSIFYDAPSTPSGSIFPVNCAKDTSSSNWPWKCYVHVNGSDNDIEEYSSGFQSISRSKSVPVLGAGEQINMSIRFYFYVQCSSSITFTVNYDLEATSPAFPFSTASVSVSAGGGSGNVSDSDSVDNGSNSSSLTASVSGSQTFTVPASIKPQLVSFSASGSSGGNIVAASGAEVSLSLSFT